MIGALVAVIGIATGLAHAASLGRGRGAPRPWSWPLRFVGVAAVLLAAALAGHVVAAASGWAGGFLAGGILAWRRLP